MSKYEQIDITNTPKHIAIIMDGNGRWAQQKGHERLFGHGFGVESVREALHAAQKMNVEFLTLYAFSTENWSRPKEEVDGLMDLLVNTISKEVDELHGNNVIISTIGDFKGLPESCQIELKNAYERTKNNTGVNLVLALNYSSRWEIVNASKKIATDVQKGVLDANEINEELFGSYLTTASMPDPELLIRTSGEHRISNFLMWQIAYSELYFADVLWPDFKKEDLYEAVLDYQSRERRFGKVSEQIVK
jgi:undecaprenyl diphosphate synthase